LCGGGLASVFDDGPAAVFCDFANGRHVGEPTMEMGDDNCPHSIAGGGGELTGIQAPGGRIDVDEHGPSSDGVDGAKIPGEVVAGEDDFVVGADFQAAQRQLDSDGTRGAEPAMWQLVHRGQALGEALAISTLVFAPTTVSVGVFDGALDVVVNRRPRRNRRNAARTAVERKLVAPLVHLVGQVAIAGSVRVNVVIITC
jgi:hypothetical protein